MKSVHGKTIVVTGAGGGIGEALVAEFLKLGATVWALDRNREALARLSETASQFAKPLKTAMVDVSDTVAMKTVFQLIKKDSSPISVWINNAGVSGLGDFMEQSHESFENTIKVNLGGVVLGTRLALEHMEEVGVGIILNVASVAGHISAPYLAAYSASKHGVVGFTRALRQELKLKNSPIKLLMASPGFVDTQMIERGTKKGFPEWLSFLLSTPKQVAHEITQGILKESEEVFPTWNGKMLLKMNRLLPEITAKSSRILLSKSLKDFILLRKQPP